MSDRVVIVLIIFIAVMAITDRIVAQAIRTPPVAHQAVEAAAPDTSWEGAQAAPLAYQQWLQQKFPGKIITPALAIVTAYTPSDEGCGPTTAAGSTSSTPGIAVRRRLLDQYRNDLTGINVPGYFDAAHPGRAWIPDDTGSALEREHLHVDIRYQDISTARQWGRREGWIFLVR